jgi:hypothetical protein
MVDADDLLQGFSIAGFSMIILSAIAYCLKRKRASIMMMKKSASMEELSSVDTTDPTQIQVEEQYALPPILVTIASPRMGSSSAGR